MIQETECVFIDGEFNNNFSNQLEILLITGITWPTYILDFGLTRNKDNSSINCDYGEQIIYELSKPERIKFGLQFGNDIDAAKNGENTLTIKETEQH